MRVIAETTKQAIIKKALNNKGQTIGEIALKNNIGRTTLNRWLLDIKSANNTEVDKNVRVGKSKTTSAERFKHLQATFGQESVMVGAYCRKHGLYPHQLTQWEAAFMTNDPDKKDYQVMQELKGLRTENKTLKHIIARKDKVLAETVALLVLKKKAAQIWGESEED